MSKRSEMLRQQNREIEKAARAQMSNAHALGLKRGTYAVAQIVLNKANDESKSIEDRLADIVEFCSKARNPDPEQDEDMQDGMQDNIQDDAPSESSTEDGHQA